MDEKSQQDEVCVQAQSDWPEFVDQHEERKKLAAMPVIDDDGVHKYAYYVMFKIQAPYDTEQYRFLEDTMSKSGVPFRLSFLNEIQELRLNFYLSLYDYKTHFHDYLQAQGLSLSLIERPCNAYTREFNGSVVQFFLFLVIVSNAV